MARPRKLLYLIKDSPFEPSSHAAQRAKALITEFAKIKEVEITFLYSGLKNQPRILDNAQGFEINSSRSLIEKVIGLVLPYHFRLLGKAFAIKAKQLLS